MASNINNSVDEMVSFPFPRDTSRWFSLLFSVLPFSSRGPAKSVSNITRWFSHCREKDDTVKGTVYIEKLPRFRGKGRRFLTITLGNIQDSPAEFRTQLNEINESRRNQGSRVDHLAWIDEDDVKMIKLAWPRNSNRLNTSEDRDSFLRAVAEKAAELRLSDERIINLFQQKEAFKLFELVEYDHENMADFLSIFQVDGMLRRKEIEKSNPVQYTYYPPRSRLYSFVLHRLAVMVLNDPEKVRNINFRGLPQDSKGHRATHECHFDITRDYVK